MLFIFKKVDTPLCSFCKSKDETPLHIFYDCIVTQCLWRQLCSLCRHKIVIPELTPQSDKFGFLESDLKNDILINHILLIFKLYVYYCRNSGSTSFLILKSKISITRDTEEIISKSSTQRYKKFQRKWNIVKEIFWKDISQINQVFFLTFIFTY